MSTTYIGDSRLHPYTPRTPAVAWYSYFFIVFSSIYFERFFGDGIQSGGLRAFELVGFTFGWLVSGFVVASSRDFKISFPSYLLPLTLLIGWSAVLLPDSPEPRLGLRATFQFLLLWGIGFTLANLSPSPTFRRRIVQLIAVVMMVHTVASIYQIYNPINAEFERTGIARSEGFFGSGNSLAFYSLFAFSLFFTLVLLGKKFWWTGIGYSFLCILLSQTRVALVILAVEGILAAYAIGLLHVGKRQITAMVVLAATLGGLMIMIPSTHFERTVNLIEDQSLDSQGTWKHRTAAWEQIFDYVLPANPVLGAGGGASEAFLRGLNDRQSLDAVHNEYLKVAADYGIVGLTLFVWWIVAMLMHARRGINRRRRVGLIYTTWDRSFHIAAFGAIVAFTLGCAMHNLVYAHEISALAMIILGVGTMASDRSRRRIRQIESIPLRSHRRV